jgi:hypothetical protein
MGQKGNDSIPEQGIDDYFLVEGETENKKKWGYADLFKNHWEHNVFLNIDGTPKRMHNLIMSASEETAEMVIREIFKAYKLKINEKPERVIEFWIELKHVISSKDRLGTQGQEVGARIPNTIRFFP